MSETPTTETSLDLTWTLPAPDPALEALFAERWEPESAPTPPEIVEGKLGGVVGGCVRFDLADGRTGECPLEELKIPGATGSLEPGQTVKVLVEGESANGGAVRVSLAKAHYLGEHAALEAQLADPAVVGDPERLREVNTRYGRLAPVVAAHAEWVGAGRTSPLPVSSRPRTPASPPRSRRSRSA